MIIDFFPIFFIVILVLVVLGIIAIKFYKFSFGDECLEMCRRRKHLKKVDEPYPTILFPFFPFWIQKTREKTEEEMETFNDK